MLKSLARTAVLVALFYTPALAQTATTKSACTATPQCSSRTDCPSGSKPMMVDSFSFGATQSSSSMSSSGMSSGRSASSSSCTCTCKPSMSSGDKSSPVLASPPVSSSKPH